MRTLRLENYTWNQFEKFFVLLWIGITVFSAGLYSGVISKDRGNELRSSLKVAGYTIGASLQAQDWDMALRHLQVTADASQLFNLELSLLSCSLSYFKCSLSVNKLTLMGVEVESSSLDWMEFSLTSHCPFEFLKPSSLP